MQNKYVADIGDWGKYGMLNYICNPSNSCSEKLLLGINWYLVKNENSSHDGKFIEYLDKNNERNIKEYRVCSEFLYDELRKIVLEGKRSVNEVQNRTILPTDTIYYDDYLSFDNISCKDINYLERRKILRAKWVSNGLEKLQHADILFFDPDNGIEVSSYKRTSTKGIKFVYYNEIIDYYNRGQSLIIYNHRDRSTDKIYLNKIKNISNYINADKIFCMRFNRYSVRDYIFVLHNNHFNVINAKIEEMLKSDWEKHFRRFEIT